jgi:uncharacterized protein YecE (DUF72 family)
MPTIRIGTAGWTVPSGFAAAPSSEPSATMSPGSDSKTALPEQQTAGGTHLMRYAAALTCVEINSSFYRPHRPATYARWAASTPPHFRFAVKMPKTITHVAKLACTPEPLDAFLSQVSALGEKLGPLLIQLPPSLSFGDAPAAEFFELLRDHFNGVAVLEPRHASWFNEEAAGLMALYRIARVAADPARVPQAATPGGWPDLVYYRLHGSPRTYYSNYEQASLESLAAELQTSVAQECWVIFDNTALGHAFTNAMELSRLVALPMT